MVNPDERAAIAAFSSHFEAATIGLQVNNMDVPTLSVTQYAVTLGSAIYAAQKVTDDGLSLPTLDIEANYSEFLQAAADHYVERLTEVAVQQAEAILKVSEDLPDAQP